VGLVSPPVISQFLGTGSTFGDLPQKLGKAPFMEISLNLAVNRYSNILTSKHILLYTNMYIVTLSDYFKKYDGFKTSRRFKLCDSNLSK
jgi:hypothetical protein